jgi:hypothetical protein
MANLMTPPENWGQPVEQVAAMAEIDFGGGVKPEPGDNALRIASTLLSLTANITAKYSPAASTGGPKTL